MLLEFAKYEGAGNDFILIYDKLFNFPAHDNELIKRLCDRSFGIGANGLILLQPEQQYDFRMVFFNSDGLESSMCGNGGRCIAAFAKRLGIIEQKAEYIAIDGIHIAEIVSDHYARLKMTDVHTITSGAGFYFLNTGSPHYVTFLPNIGNIDVFSLGQKIRFSEKYRNEGVNVNFVEDRRENIFVRTYERGVENETLACGTGAVAAAICKGYKNKYKSGTHSIPVMVLGGELKVSFNKKSNRFFNIWLEGPVNFVFEGEIDVHAS